MSDISAGVVEISISATRSICRKHTVIVHLCFYFVHFDLTNAFTRLSYLSYPAHMLTYIYIYICMYVFVIVPSVSGLLVWTSMNTSLLPMGSVSLERGISRPKECSTELIGEDIMPSSLLGSIFEYLM